MEKDHLTLTAFKSLPLTESLQESLEDCGFGNCTPIQAETLPLALQGIDIAGQSQTGTGKTAAFLLATIHYLMETPVEMCATGPWAIILAPTRELALQIHQEACLLGQYTGLKFAAVYGGTGYENQRQQLKDGVDVVIGTPGRLIDYHKQGVLVLDRIEVVVLDEADRMFDLGFITDIRFLLRRMPKPDDRFNLLFSATLSHRVMELAYEHMNAPKLIKVETETITADKVKQRLYHVAVNEKIPVLLGLLHKHPSRRSVIFTNTKAAAEKLTDWLNANGHDADVISGDIPQNKRQQLLQRIQAGNLPILVATDVAARGLHIESVDLVVNFDLPQDAEDYVHRIGRTARIGATGTALSLACEEYVYSLPEIEEFIGQTIPVEKITDDLLTDPKRPKHRPRPPRHANKRPHARRPRKKQGE